MTCLGLNVYYWGSRQQDQLLVDCLGPLMKELREAGLLECFWYDRYDSRGPHLFVVAEVPENRKDEVQGRTATRLDRYLAENPSREELSLDQLAGFHDGTRGRLHCAEDARPGFGANNSYVFFEQAPQDYPFWISAGLPRQRELWRLLDDLAFWVIGQIAEHPVRPPVGAAVRWMAGLDDVLTRLGLARAYWRYHATTLLMGLRKRLETGEAEVLSSLKTLVGTKNHDTFSRLWAAASEGGSGWPHLSRLIELSLPEVEGVVPDRCFIPLREAVHCAWKQLGLTVQLEIPLVLFAWNRSL